MDDSEEKIVEFKTNVKPEEVHEKLILLSDSEPILWGFEADLQLRVPQGAVISALKSIVEYFSLV